jgi:hypothetical protein
MLSRSAQLHSLDDLHDYVNEILCEHFQLQLDAFQLTQRILRRGGQPCGIYFCLHGPRAVKFTAIWETDRNCILFYGPNGERFQKTQLLEAPSLDSYEPYGLTAATT